MFVKTSSGERFNVLISGEYGAWMISYDEPQAPVYADSEAFSKHERIKPPEEYVSASTMKKTVAAESRYQLILPLLQDVRGITDADFRNTESKRIAEENHTTAKRVRKLFYRYLATGKLIDGKPRETVRKPEFDRAIRCYYFSAKRNSLRTTYELMLLDSYTDSDGVLIEPVPTLEAFRMYYYRLWSKDPQKIISRDGLGNYRRNERPLYGSAMAYRTKIGSYAIDETPADLHVVSSMDRTKSIGRPNVYLAVDIATQMITGVYVGMDAGENALMTCIANAASSKVQFCADLGIMIDDSDWPCVGMPSEIICDRGGEFCSERMGELCLQYGVDLNMNEPFRPDLKSIVERNIGLIQESYRSMLEGNGITLVITEFSEFTLSGTGIGKGGTGSGGGGTGGEGGGEQKGYTVTWKSQDGKSILETDTNVAGGTSPNYDGAAPTKADDANYTYTFVGWALSANQTAGVTLEKVTNDITYYAAFSATPKGSGTGEISGKLEGSTVTVNCQLSSGYIFVAEYKNGQMKNVQSQVLSGTPSYVFAISDIDSVIKYFILDLNYAPVCSAGVIGSEGLNETENDNLKDNKTTNKS